MNRENLLGPLLMAGLCPLPAPTWIIKEEEKYPGPKLGHLNII